MPIHAISTHADGGCQATDDPRHLVRGKSGRLLWTVGHSTRSIEALVAVLTAHDIEVVVDGRRFPGSRRMPHFASLPLADSLNAHGLAYAWLPELGGRRQLPATSTDTGDETAWRHPAFRAYAAHTSSEEFAQGLFALLMIAEGLRTTVMCAELLWWRCHRRLISDVVLSLGIPVAHIRDERAAEPHRLSAPARLIRGRLSYASV